MGQLVVGIFQKEKNMKELMKPLELEQAYGSVELFAERCDLHCSLPDCDKWCTGQGGTNYSVPADNDILF